MKKLFAIILALLLLTGCSWDHPTTDGQPFQNETAPASGGSVTASDGSVTASDGSGPVPSQTKTIHVEKTLEENLRVDLDLTIPGSDDDPGTYLAEMPPIDQDSINRFLEAQGDSVTEVTGESTFDGVYRYNANTKLGEIHWSRRSRENIRPYNTMSYHRTEASVYPHYLGSLQYWDDDDSSFLSRFPEKDLPFMTLAQAEQKAIDALAL
ncbi:MAG: lipoprotein, partial [Oscillospiraceae bacterium]|nr:lipoprotein [Oscillospiraceae bacterium]